MADDLQQQLQDLIDQFGLKDNWAELSPSEMLKYPPRDQGAPGDPDTRDVSQLYPVMAPSTSNTQAFWNKTLLTETMPQSDNIGDYPSGDPLMMPGTKDAIPNRGEQIPGANPQNPSRYWIAPPAPGTQDAPAKKILDGSDPSFRNVSDQQAPTPDAPSYPPMNAAALQGAGIPAQTEVGSIVPTADTTPFWTQQLLYGAMPSAQDPTEPKPPNLVPRTGDVMDSAGTPGTQDQPFAKPTYSWQGDTISNSGAKPPNAPDGKIDWNYFPLVN
jgi:hypothetical protein